MNISSQQPASENYTTIGVLMLGAYALIALIASAAPVDTEMMTPAWFSTGICVAVVMFYGYAWVIPASIAALAVNVLLDYYGGGDLYHRSESFGFLIFHTASIAILSRYFTRLLLGDHIRFHSLKHVSIFLLVPSFGVCFLICAISHFAMAEFNLVASHVEFLNILRWWVTDFIGILMAVSILLLFHNQSFLRKRMLGLAALILIVALTKLAYVYLFYGAHESQNSLLNKQSVNLSLEFKHLINKTIRGLDSIHALYIASN